MLFICAQLPPVWSPERSIQICTSGALQAFEPAIQIAKQQCGPITWLSQEYLVKLPVCPRETNMRSDNTHWAAICNHRIEYRVLTIVAGKSK